MAHLERLRVKTLKRIGQNGVSPIFEKMKKPDSRESDGTDTIMAE